jgi:hypothetical protein
VTGRGTWGPARRARCRAPGADTSHAGARARGGGWCVGYAARKADQGAAVESWERGAPLARERDDRARVLARAGGRARTAASGVTSRAVSEGNAVQAGASRISVGSRHVKHGNRLNRVPKWTSPRGSEQPSFPLDSIPEESPAAPSPGAYTDSACTGAPCRAPPRPLSLRISLKNDGGGLYGIQEVDGSIPFSSTTSSRIAPTPARCGRVSPGLNGIRTVDQRGAGTPSPPSDPKQPASARSACGAPAGREAGAFDPVQLHHFFSTRLSLPRTPVECPSGGTTVSAAPPRDLSPAAPGSWKRSAAPTTGPRRRSTAQAPPEGPRPCRWLP